MINKQDLTLLQTMVEGEKKALEFSVGSRTFQIMGVKGAAGMYERHFHKSSHPTRSNLGVEAMVTALNSATTELQLYRGEKGGEDAIFFPNADAALVAAKAWLGMPAEPAPMSA